MSVKQFFKGTAFKCIAVLLSILLVCGILLTICNSLFYVSAEERLSRAISKIYGEEVTYEVETADEQITLSSAKVSEVYKITSADYEGDYLLKVTGMEGFSGGTVTCWVRVNAAEKGAQVKKISIDSNVGQSYINKVSGSALDKLVGKQENEGFTGFDTEGIKTGATFSMGAISNAANGARDYVNKKYMGTVSKFEGYQYAEHIDEASTVKVTGTAVEYTITTNGGGIWGKFIIAITVDVSKTVTKITEYEIKQNGSSVIPDKGVDYTQDMSQTAYNLKDKTLEDIKGYLALNDDVKDDVINTGATLSNTLCYESAAFALANYEKALAQFAEGGAQ